MPFGKRARVICSRCWCVWTSKAKYKTYEDKELDVKLKILLLLIVAALLIAAAGIHLVRFTVVNKSGEELFIKLEDGKKSGNQSYYFLTIPVGTRSDPETLVYTLMPDVYKTRVTSVKGNACLIPDYEERSYIWRDFTGNRKWTFIPCYNIDKTATWDEDEGAWVFEKFEKNIWKSIPLNYYFNWGYQY